MAKKQLIYAGIGSRQTPIEVLQAMEQIGYQLGLSHWLLRSGHAEGADMAFEAGCLIAGGKKEIYVPWYGFNGAPKRNPDYLMIENETAMEVAGRFHPNWDACSRPAKLLHTRNGYQVAGPNLDVAADMIVCWTKGGLRSGGTGQALRMAEHLNIPIFDLAIAADWPKLEEFTRVIEASNI